MASFLGGLGQGLGAIGAGVGRGELLGSQYEMKARQQKALEDYKQQLLALQGDKLKSSADIAAERINQSQRQMFGRKAQMISRTLDDPNQVANMNRFPGMLERLRRERDDATAVATGQLDWRQVKPSEMTDPITGEVRLPPGVEGPFTGPKPGPWAPGMASGAPWQPQPGQPLSENPYLSTKEQGAQQRVETGQAGQAATEAYQQGQLDIGRGHLAIAGTKANADLVERQFRDTLDLAKSQLAQGNTTFQQQQQIWGRLLSYAAATAKAGGDPGKDLKPFLFAHGMMGLQVPNDAVIRDYLARNGESEDVIQKVIQGNPLHGSGKRELTQPGGAQPTGAVMGSFQSTSGPPWLPANLPGGGPPTPAQMASAETVAPGGARVAPINGPASSGARGNVNATAAGMGINTPTTAPPLRSPYSQGTVEDEVFGALTGRNGAPIPAKTILQNFQGTPYFRKVADVINRTNTSQQEGLFAGMPVAGTNGAEWPNVPGFTAGQVQIPGAAVFAPPGTTPVVNQGGYGPPPQQPLTITPVPQPPPEVTPPMAPPAAPQPQPRPAPPQAPPQPRGGPSLLAGPPARPGPPVTGAGPKVPPMVEEGPLAVVPPAEAPNNLSIPMTAIERKQIAGEVQRYQKQPLARGMEQWFKERHITKPEDKHFFYQWATEKLIPSIMQQSNLGAKGVAANIYQYMQEFAHF